MHSDSTQGLRMTLHIMASHLHVLAMKKRLVHLAIFFLTELHPFWRRPCIRTVSEWFLYTQSKTEKWSPLCSGAIKPMEDLNKILYRMPIHIVFGDINDALFVRVLQWPYSSKLTPSSSREVHDAITDPKSGRRFASITRIQRCGHLVSITSVCLWCKSFYNTITRFPNLRQMNLAK